MAEFRTVQKKNPPQFGIKRYCPPVSYLIKETSMVLK